MATELVTGCWQLDLRGVNAFLIEDDVVTLVDAGTAWDETEIRAELTEAGYTPSDVERVLITHYDLDHVGTLGALAPEMDATVYAGSPDAEILVGDRSPSFTTLKGLFQRLTASFVDDPELPVEPVADGDRIGSFTVFETPGHTPGHVAYVSESLGVAFLGDLVIEDDGVLSASPWYLSYDRETILDSVRSLADRAPAFDVLCMGHGEPIVPRGSETLQALAAEARSVAEIAPSAKPPDRP